MAMGANPLALSLAYALHMVATVIWIGGLLYQTLFVLPVVRKIPDPKITQTLLERLRTRFQPVAWLSLVVLIGTGLIQMAANPNYDGFLTVGSMWAKAILLKHLAIAFMILIAAYQSFVLYPRLTRALLLQQRTDIERVGKTGVVSDHTLLRLNVLLSIIVLLLTSIARVA